MGLKREPLLLQTNSQHAKILGESNVLTVFVTLGPIRSGILRHRHNLSINSYLNYDQYPCSLHSHYGNDAYE